jgi:hypothetical protein
MPIDSSQDPRDRLVREKYFCLRPKPLERWIWKHGLPQAAERVFWLHWEEGMRRRTWCSEIPIRRVAAECRVDVSTVSRAYQRLLSLGLIRRQDPGRDPANPFEQATSITEVRVPRALLVELGRFPSRPDRRLGLHSQQAERALSVGNSPDNAASVVPPVSSQQPEKMPCALPTRAHIQAIWTRISDSERGRYYNASRAGATGIVFDANSRLGPEEQEYLLQELRQMSHARGAAPERSNSVQPTAKPTNSRRRLSPLEFARVRRGVLEAAGANQASEILRQVIWAVEEGALRRFEPPMAINIALKKIRQGVWSRPNRMPPNWTRLDAAPEYCSAA